VGFVWALPATWVMVLGVAMPGIVHAARIITIDDAIGIALERNVTLNEARVTARLRGVAVSEARMQFLPDLTLTSSGTKSFGRYYDSSTGGTVDQTSNSMVVQASSGVTLFAGLHDVAALRQAKLNDRAGRLDLGRAQQTAVYTVLSNFLALILQQDQLRVAREELAAESALEDRIREYVKSGSRASADLYEQQAIVASAKLTVVQAENAAELSEVVLMRTLQLDPVESYEFTAPTLESLYVAENADLEDLVTRALAQRSDLRAEEDRVSALEQGIHIASSGYWPTVSLQAGYGSDYDSLLPQGFDNQLNAYRNGSVQLNVSVPLFDREVTHNGVRRAKLQAQNERIVLEGLRHDVELQVKTVYLDYHAARDQLAAAEGQQHAAKLAVDSAQERFKAGVAILVEVSQARTLYVRAEAALAAARNNLALQSALMSYYLGRTQATSTYPAGAEAASRGD
jgi:outer membrane protein